jgi:hypothetical protein
VPLTAADLDGAILNRPPQFLATSHLEGSDQLSGYAVKQLKLNGVVLLFVALERVNQGRSTVG